jgi:hypothetical protein
MDELVGKIFVLTAAALIVFAIMFGLTAKVQVNGTAIMNGAPASVIQSQ